MFRILMDHKLNSPIHLSLRDLNSQVGVVPHQGSPAVLATHLKIPNQTKHTEGARKNNWLAIGITNRESHHMPKMEINIQKTGKKQ